MGGQGYGNPKVQYVGDVILVMKQNLDNNKKNCAGEHYVHLPHNEYDEILSKINVGTYMINKSQRM